MSPAEDGMVSDPMRSAWDALLGHSRQIGMICRLLEQGRIAGTYLFSGPAHIGKQSVAMALAKVLLCEAKGCSQCKTCKELDAMAHPDCTVLLPKGASQTIGKDQIDFLHQRSHLKSFHGGWKIGIVADAHFLHPVAAPALLKLLEEPPERSVFVLLSDKEDQVLPTLRSRCKPVRFFPLSMESMQEVLAMQMQCAQADVAKRFGPLLALAAGRPGLALAMAQGDFFASREKILQCLQTLKPGDFSSVLGVVEGLCEMTKSTVASSKSAEGDRDEPAAPSRKALERSVLDTLQTLLRDVWLIQHGYADTLLHSDKRETLQDIARRWEGAPVGQWLEDVQNDGKDLEVNVALRLILEKCFVTLGVR